jgi:hypothetical protein
MALTLSDSAALINDPTFRGRVKVAAVNYAQYLQLQPSLSASKSRWIQNTMTQPDQAAQQLTPGVVLNPSVQNAGAAVTDADLKAATQVVADLQM